jgi:ABC-type multidrug transport system ATPase subunit
MGAMPASAKEVKDLVKSHPAAIAVGGASSTIARGVITARPSGNSAGKTTIWTILPGLSLPPSGSVLVLGENILRPRCRVLPPMNFSSPAVDLPDRPAVRQILLIYARVARYAAGASGSRSSPRIGRSAPCSIGRRVNGCCCRTPPEDAGEPRRG